MKFKINTLRFLTEDLKERQESFNIIKANWDEFVDNAKKISQQKTNADSAKIVDQYLTQLQTKFAEIQQLTSTSNKVLNIKTIIDSCEEYLAISNALLNDKNRISYHTLLQKRTNIDSQIIDELKNASKGLAQIKTGDLDRISQKVLQDSLIIYIEELHKTITTTYDIKNNTEAQDLIERGKKSKEYRQSILNSIKEINLDKVEELVNNYPVDIFSNPENAVAAENSFESTLKAISSGIIEFNKKGKNGSLKISSWLVGPKYLVLLDKLAEHLKSLITQLEEIEKNKKERAEEAELAVEMSKLDNLGEDWNALYESCNTKEDYAKFWDKYFSEVWGKYGEYIRHLYNFIPNLVETKDWTSNNNPYIRELRKIINNQATADIVKIKNFNNYFRIIIDSYKKGERHLNKLDLISIYDIILNSSFYKLNYNDAEEYLTLQNEVINTYNQANSVYLEKLPQADAENDEAIKQNAKDNARNIWAYISLKSGGSKNFKNPPLNPTNEPLSTLGHARKKCEILGLGADIIKKANKKEIITDDTIKSIISKVKDTPKVAGNLISYITITFKSQFSNLFDEYKDKNLLNKYRDKYSEISNSDAKLFDSYLKLDKHLNYTSKQMKTLLDELLKITDPQITKETK